MRRRLDSELVRRALATSRQDAKELIDAGRVKVAGRQATKAATQVETSVAIVVTENEGPRYVSRGAHKLIGALEALGPAAPVIAGKRCLDAGASTGGFTQVLLERGAASVLSVDVGYGQLAWSLREDPRVEVLERTNIRYLTPDQVGAPPEVVVADLSFISLELVLPALQKCAPAAEYLVMVKPQFEVGKDQVGRGGVIWDPDLRAEAVARVANFAAELGFTVWAIEPSPLPGPAGNVEYFLALSAGPGRKPLADLAAASRAAVASGPQPNTTEQSK